MIYKKKEILTRKELWDAAREIITHEDTLTHYRMIWLLQYNGFLFATVGLIVGAINNPTQNDYLSVLLMTSFGLFACYLGWILNKSSYFQLLGAFQQLEVVTLWWNEKRKSLFPGDTILESIDTTKLESPEGPNRTVALKSLGDILRSQTLPPIRNWFNARGRPRRYELPQHFQIGWVVLGSVLVFNGVYRSHGLYHVPANADAAPDVPSQRSNESDAQKNHQQSNPSVPLANGMSTGEMDGKEAVGSAEVLPPANASGSIPSNLAPQQSPALSRTHSSKTLGNSLFVVCASLMFIVAFTILQRTCDSRSV